MKKKTLVIMAAGMGSRFGGLKQIEPVGPNGEIIADYSVYDAIRAGFDKVIFIIRESNLEYFKENISSKFENKIKVEYAFQELNRIPKDVKLPENRIKMLGTGHALLCAKSLIDSDFVLINSDDFYGFDSYKIASKFFEESKDDLEYLSVNYPFNITSSENGAVKRGVIFTKDEYMINNLECEISKNNGKYIAKELDSNNVFEIEENQAVSVNFFGLKKTFLKYLEEEFNEFIHGKIDEKNEFLLPTIIKKGIENNDYKVKCKISTSKWMGITYKEDLPKLKKDLQELIKKGEYPEKLWE